MGRGGLCSGTKHREGLSKSVAFVAFPWGAFIRTIVSAVAARVPCYGEGSGMFHDFTFWIFLPKTCSGEISQ